MTSIILLNLLTKYCLLWLCNSIVALVASQMKSEHHIRGFYMAIFKKNNVSHFFLFVGGFFSFGYSQKKKAPGGGCCGGIEHAWLPVCHVQVTSEQQVGSAYGVQGAEHAEPPS